MKPPISVAIVEDERPSRELLSRLVEQTGGLRSLGAYANAEAALLEIPRQPPDVVLMDLCLPNLSGVECVRELKRRLPALKIVALTKYEDADQIFAALKAGADGYLLKRNAMGELFQAIATVMEGGAPMSGEVARRVVTHFHEQGKAAAETERLSPRETEVLEHLARGLSYKEIAAKLGITYQTVNGHLKAIYEKLHVHSRTEAVVKFLKR